MYRNLISIIVVFGLRIKCNSSTFELKKARSIVLFAGFFFVIAIVSKAQALKIGIISACEEYDSDGSLKMLQEQLEASYNVKTYWMQGGDDRISDDLPDGFDEWLYDAVLPHNLDNIEYLDSIDVLLLFSRRLILSEEKMDKIKSFTQSGVPIVGIRNATAAFLLWLDFAPEVLGGEYFDHYKPSSLEFNFKIVPEALNNPIVKGFRPWTSHNLYKHKDLGPNTELLLEGNLLNGEGTTEAVSWTNVYNDTRMFYISLGTPVDFANKYFIQLLINAVDWTTMGALKSKKNSK